MADLNVMPVGDKIEPPRALSLAEIVNIASAITQNKQSKIALNLDQQKQQERQALQSYLSNPQNFQNGGKIDIEKLNSEIPKLAPLTGSDFMQKYTILNNAQTIALEASQKLTQSQREMIASRLSVMGRLGVKNKKAYVSELDQLTKENPDNNDLKKLVQSYKDTINILPDDANLPQIAIAGAQSLLTPTEQETAFSPQAGTIDTGAATFQTSTQPSIAGQPPIVSVAQNPLVTKQNAPAYLS